LSIELLLKAWLCLNLQQQKLELKRYVSNQEAPPGAVLGAWKHQKPYKRLIPSGASAHVGTDGNGQGDSHWEITSSRDADRQ
jgi:hypothetical protein